MITTRFNNIKDIWENSIEMILGIDSETGPCSDINSIGSYFGKEMRTTKEMLGFSFVLDNPRNRILFSDIRRVNYSYLFANFLFLFSKEKTIDFIEFYNTKGKLFSDDGKTLNAPLGYRILNNKNQINEIKELLQRDQSTRRAVIQVLEKSDIGKNTKDFPCVNYFQLLVRNNKLSFITNMRSQSVFGILPYDVFLFSLFQEALACYLNFELGEYIHFSGSYHIYNNEFEKSGKIIQHRDSLSFEMRKMQRFDENILKELFRAEETIRVQILSGKKIKLDFLEYDLDEYWKSFLRAMFNSYLFPDKDVKNLKNILHNTDVIKEIETQTLILHS